MPANRRLVSVREWIAGGDDPGRKASPKLRPDEPIAKGKRAKREAWVAGLIARCGAQDWAELAAALKGACAICRRVWSGSEHVHAWSVTAANPKNDTARTAIEFRAGPPTNLRV